MSAGPSPRPIPVKSLIAFCVLTPLAVVVLLYLYLAASRGSRGLYSLPILRSVTALAPGDAASRTGHRPSQSAPPPKRASVRVDGKCRPFICFVHVGKCGGGSVEAALGDAGHGKPHMWIGDFVLTDWPASYERASAGWEDRAALLSLHYTRLTGRSAAGEECLDRRLVVLWVCDPVQRLVSSYRWAFEQRSVQRMARVSSSPAIFCADRFSLEPGQARDMELVVDLLAASGSASLGAEFLASFNHGQQSLSWYLDSVGDSHCSKLDLLDGAADLFVGTRENLDKDVGRLLEHINASRRSRGATAVRAHHSKLLGRNLSAASVTFLRSFANVEADYACLEALAGKGLLDESYVGDLRRRGEYAV